VHLEITTATFLVNLLSATFRGTRSDPLGFWSGLAWFVRDFHPEGRVSGYRMTDDYMLLGYVFGSDIQHSPSQPVTAPPHELSWAAQPSSAQLLRTAVVGCGMIVLSSLRARISNEDVSVGRVSLLWRYVRVARI